MRTLQLLGTSALVLGLVWVLSAQTVSADDIVKVAPKSVKVLLDNEHVRVLEYRAKPGEKAEMHSHPPNVVYALSSGKVRFTSADGKTTDREIKAGQAIWSDAVTHATENIGKSETRVLLVELKEQAKK